MSNNNDTPRYDVKSKSYYEYGGLGGKKHETTVRDNSTGKEYKGTSSQSAEKSRDNAFDKANKDRS